DDVEAGRPQPVECHLGRLGELTSWVPVREHREPTVPRRAADPGGSDLVVDRVRVSGQQHPPHRTGRSGGAQGRDRGVPQEVTHGCRPWTLRVASAAGWTCLRAASTSGGPARRGGPGANLATWPHRPTTGRCRSPRRT